MRVLKLPFAGAAIVVCMHLVDITMFYAPEGGGVSTYLNAKARWFGRRAQLRHTVASPNVDDGGDAPARVALAGVRLPGINGYRLPLSVGAPARLLARLQPDLIEAGDAGPCAWSALRAGRALGVPVAAFYHSDLPRLVGNRFGALASVAARSYVAQLYNRFDVVFAPSRLMVGQLAAMGVAGAVHQPLGVDTSVFSPRRRVGTLRARLCLPASTRLLVYAGRFTAEKKLHLLIDAVQRLGRPYHLLLVGGGVAFPRHPQVTLMPFLRDPRQLARLLASSDALVHPGDCETFGLVALEAMACGLPVLATTGGSVAELVDAQCGVLVPPNSVAMLCAGIDALYAGDRARLGAAACQRARGYDWARVMPQLMGRYASLLAAGTRAGLEAERACVPE